VRSCRRLGAVVAAIGVALAAGPTLAQATTFQANCTTFPGLLANAGSADTIVLTGMCSGASNPLPNVTGLTITGAATGTNGFDGTGASGPALTGGANANGLTLSRLTFQNYATTAVRLNPNNPSTPYSFANDTFSHNAQPFDAVNGSGGGLSLLLTGSCTFSATAVTITDSTFDSNTAGGATAGSGGGGGGAYLESACSTAVTMTLDGNRFTNNRVTPSGSNGGNGGGLYVATGIRGITTPALTLHQDGNLFRGNSVTGSGGSYAGGGEYTNGANITSAGDGFINNTLPGPSVPAGSSEGGGLATFGGGLCIVPEGVTSTASNLVAAGNAIGAPTGTGTGGGVEGAGVYVGCGFNGGAYHMSLINSTISGNAATGAPANAVAGIDGESIDFLGMDNTILAGDSGGAEIGGFGASPGQHVTAEGSDVCDLASTTTPFAGSHNICAAPLLVDPTHGDVHETAASPTVDVGFNSDAFGLSTDYYRRPRVELGKGASNSALVDAGASEFHPTAPTATNCSQIDALITQAENGDVITIATMCTGGSFTIPDDTRLTLQGAATGTNGFDGIGATGEALHGNRSVGLTLRNLTIRNYAVGPTKTAVELQLEPGPLPTIDHVQFLRNTSGGEPGGLLVNGFPNGCGLTGSLTITGSTFSDNVNGGGSQPQGGGAVIDLGCPANLVISGNVFSGNTVQSSFLFGYGAGLLVLNESGGQLVTAQQDHNVFRGNTVESTGQSNSIYFGAGETVSGVTLTSTDDTFIDNALPAPVGPNSASEGAGLGITDQVCGGPGTRAPTTAVNLVAAGNTIGAPGSGGTGGGAGVFAGCAFNSSFTGGALTLINATISGNSFPGGNAGLAGQPSGALTLSNSVVAANAGATDIGGFGLSGGGGSAAVSYSDVCKPGASAPLPGAHNLCADPKLTGASTGDVHETSASPTIDAGSNALVPAGTSTDAYGAARIFATKTCAAVVDIGAAEFGTRTAVCPPPPPPAAAKTVVRSEKATTTGVDVVLGCTGKGTCAGTVTLTTTETRLGKRVIAVASAKRPVRHKVLVTVGTASYRVTAGKRTTVHVKLNGTGSSLLARFRKLPVTVRVTQTVGKKTAGISSRKQTVLAPKRKRKH
jgi:hypothetical protein